jgi:hypothetical protein
MIARIGWLACLVLPLVACFRGPIPPMQLTIERQARWLAGHFKQQQVLVVKGAGKADKPARLEEETNGEDPFVNSPDAEALFFVVFPRNTGIATVSLDGGQGARPLAPPRPIFKMPTSPQATHFLTNGRILGRLGFFDSHGRELFFMVLNKQAAELRGLPLFWRDSPGGGADLDWDSLPTTVYSKKP